MANGMRTRNFVSIVYPESAPANWLDILEQSCVEAFVSPLHDKDVNYDDGEIKKPHHHVMIMFQNVKTELQAQEIFNSIGGIKCQKVANLRGQARYLCHLDNPDKVQYSIDDVISLSGADYRDIISLASDDRMAFYEIRDYCRTYNITNYVDLIDYICENKPDWLNAATHKYVVAIKEYIKGLYLKGLIK